MFLPTPLVLYRVTMKVFFLRKYTYAEFRLIGDGLDPEEYKSYREAFEAFDWNRSGRISHTSLQVIFCAEDYHKSTNIFFFLLSKIVENFQ